MSTPRYFSNPFADTGDRTAVPDAPPIGNTVNYDTGWTPPYSLATSNPASLKVSRTAENQLFYDVTLLAKQLQETGILPWRDDVVYEVNGVVIGSNAVVYQAVVSTTNVDPTLELNQDNWRIVVAFPHAVGGYVPTVGSTNSFKLLSPGEFDSPQGVWPDAATLFFRSDSGDNTGAVTATIEDNASMTSIPIVTTPGNPLEGGELLDDYVYGLQYHAGNDEFVLMGGVATLTTYGITRLTDSIASSSIATAATPNSVRLGTLVNNFSFVGSTSSGYYRDNDSGFTVQFRRIIGLTFTDLRQNTNVTWHTPFSSVTGAQITCDLSGSPSSTAMPYACVNTLFNANVNCYYLIVGTDSTPSLNGDLWIVGYGFI